MRLIALALIPALASAFVAPGHHGARLSSLRMANEIENAASDLVQKAEDVLDKADSNVLNRGIRIINHVPIVYTLRAFGQAVSSTRFGIDAAPSVFAGAVSTPALLGLPNYIFYAWPVIAVAQLAEVSVSALAGDNSDLSQSDISSLAVANFAAAKAITSANPLPWLAATGVLSALPLRNAGNGASSDNNLRNASFQLMSSFATVTALLGVTAKISGVLPDFKFKGEVIGSVALFLYYSLVNREGNGLVKRLVNFGAIAGITVSRLMAIGGLSRDLLSASLIGAGAVTWIALQKVVDKLD